MFCVGPIAHRHLLLVTSKGPLGIITHASWVHFLSNKQWAFSFSFFSLKLGGTPPPLPLSSYIS